MPTITILALDDRTAAGKGWERMGLLLGKDDNLPIGNNQKKKNTRTLSFLQKFGQETFILLNGDYDHDDSIM